MRLLLVSNLLPPHYIGGYEIAAKEYGDALRARGHDVYAVTSNYHVMGDYEDSDWIERTLRENEDYDSLLSCNRSYSRISDIRSHVWDHQNAKTIRRALSTFKPDLVYSWKCGGLSVAPMWLPLDKNIPVVVQLCDDWLLKYRRYKLKEYLSGTPRKTIIFHLMFHKLKRMTLFATSSSIKEECLQAGYPEKRIHIIPYGLADDFWKNAEVVERKDGRRKVLFVGQLWEGKGVHCLIEAMKILTTKYPEFNFTLDVIGSCLKDYESRLKELSRSYGLTERITFHGRKPRSELWKMYKEYDMLVMPSIWQEPQGNTLLEAMVNGLPVLVSRVGGLPDVVENEISGLMFEPGRPEAIAESILKLSNSESLARKIAQGAIDRNSEKFNLTYIIPKIETIFEKEVTGSKT